MPSEYRIGPLAEIPEGGGVLAVAGEVEVGVFRVGGELRAYENRCRHQGGPVCTGEIVGRYEAVLNPDRTVAGERFADDQVRIVCPWHGWEYDLVTGACVADPRFRLRRFEVAVREGQVYVRV
ncbi:MAG TPA: Rieske (2Fe-2S) protein [Candidatus Dormibacteraeota bacterium]|nr:Rieske (2Fe-2S) protein [Candidatus Dormibacteraeota bacterium]